MASLSRGILLCIQLVSGRPHNPVPHAERFGLFPFRSPLLRESQLISLPGGTEMVHFPPFAPALLWIQRGVTGHDSRRVSPFGHPRVEARSSSPGLFAAYDALHRLPAPRHPPYALSSLTMNKKPMQWMMLSANRFRAIYLAIRLSRIGSRARSARP